METEQPYAAADALRDARAARDSLAVRAAAPAYFYPLLGVGLGILVAGSAVGGFWPFIAVAISLGLSLGLILRYREAAGVWVAADAERGPMPKWLIAYAAGLGVLVLASSAVAIAGWSAWWGLPLGLVTFVMVVFVGRIASSWQAREFTRDLAGPPLRGDAAR